jgi:hypothetical protein
MKNVWKRVQAVSFIFVIDVEKNSAVFVNLKIMATHIQKKSLIYVLNVANDSVSHAL